MMSNLGYLFVRFTKSILHGETTDFMRYRREKGGLSGVFLFIFEACRF